MRTAPAEAGALCKFYGGCLSLAASPPDLGRNLTSPRANPWVPPRGRLIERQRRGWGGLSPSHEQIKKKPRTRGASRGFGFRVEPVMGRDSHHKNAIAFSASSRLGAFARWLKKCTRPQAEGALHSAARAWGADARCRRSWGGRKRRALIARGDHVPRGFVAARGGDALHVLVRAGVAGRTRGHRWIPRAQDQRERWPQRCVGR